MRLRLLALLTVAAAPLAAQPAAPIELGVDANITRDDRSDATTFALPLGRVRAGFFLSPSLSLEPALSVQRTSAENGSSTRVGGALGLLAHLGGVPTGRYRTTSVYVRPFVGFDRFSFDPDDGDGASATQGNVGAGLGAKFPVGDRLAWRLEAVYTRLLETDDAPSGNLFGLNLGLSFHTR